MKTRTFSARNIMIPSTGRNIRLLLLQPEKNALPPEETPAVLWLHGGGYSQGFPEMAYISRALPLVRKYGAVVLAPGYRKSGEAPYPAALEDAYAALLYLKGHALELGASPDRIMVGGESAGGGLTAALCMLARDRGEVKIRFQMPLYPMLDDRDTDSSRRNYSLGWNTPLNHRGWRKYLRGVAGETPVYAAPARQTDYSGLPPAYTFVGDREPFYCETLAYVENLRRAGVPARVDVYAHCFFHGFDLLTPWRRVSRNAASAFEKAFLAAARPSITDRTKNLTP